MLELGKLQLLLQELDTLHIGITGLCEHRWKNDGKFTNGNHTIYFSGNEKGGSNGVAIILDKQYADAVKSFKPVNDRLLSLKLNTKPTIVNIIQVYAPTTASSDEDIETFYNDLQNLKDQIPNREVCIIMGDFNPKVGEGESKDSGIGYYGLGERNERGEMLETFCQANDMAITNSIFKQPFRRRYTWISPGRRTRNQVDYILVDKAWKSIVLNSKTKPGADCDTDHILVTAKIRLKSHTVPRTKLQPMFDIDKLENPIIAADFTIETNNRFSVLLDEWKSNDAGQK